jgi:hypothetical protein
MRWLPLALLLVLVAVLTVFFVEQQLEKRRRQAKRERTTSRPTKSVRFHPYTRIKFYNSEAPSAWIASEQDFTSATK